jgi:ComF family protein
MITHMLAPIVRSILDFCFPWTCAVCKNGFEAAAAPAGGSLCAACETQLTKLQAEPACPACAASLPMHRSPCPYCLGKGPTNYDRVARLAAFHEPLRAVIHHLKYHRRWGTGEELAERLAKTPAANDLLRQADVLVPVPLHWRRQIPRGYNQAEVLARHLGKLANLPVARAIKRVIHTEQQTRLHSPTQRAENLRDAFRLVKPAAVTGRRVVVIDDVWTTGATMQAVARALKPAKPKSLSAIVIARTDPRGVERVTNRPEADVELDP